MKPLEPKDFSSGIYPDKFGNDIIAKYLLQFFNLNKVNKLYKENIDKLGIEFINSVIASLNLNYEINEQEINRIPKTGAFITISNHPLGGIDGLLLMKIMNEIRPDFKFLANYLLHKLEPVSEFSIPINEFENDKLGRITLSGVKKALNHLETGNCLGIFPAGRASTYKRNITQITDKRWQLSLLKFMKNAKVPVVPIYFQGNNTALYHILGNIHPLLQAARLPKEIMSKKNKMVKVRIGTPISVKDQDEFVSISQYGRFLRAKTYALGSTLEIKKFFRPRFVAKIPKAEPIIDPINNSILLEQINHIKKDYTLFESGDFSVICAPANEMPDILTELGRLREITFREVGEGTNRALDVDEFDLYFHHLIIWDNKAGKIAGAYRVGKGREILLQYGVKGFYIQSLFKIEPQFYSTLVESIELGRSFIIKEYQRKPLSLFLLWKGLLYFILKNKEYRYLIGPASISNEFSKFSKGLIVEFFEKHYYNKQLAQYIKPRKRFRISKKHNHNTKVFLEYTGNNLNKLDQYVQDIDPGFRIPVLFKKYISLNAKVIGFNIDPKFNDCLDGLIILDIFDVPINTIKSLSKEINDNTILERFNINE